VIAHKEDQPFSGLRAFSANPGKLGMCLIIAADATVYLAILAAYAHLRAMGVHWPRPLTWWPSGALAISMSFSLSTGAAAVLAASRQSRRGRPAKAARWMAISVISGLVFDALQLKLWATVKGQGATLTHNPWGTPLFGAYLLVLTSLICTHVTVGVFYSGFVARKVSVQKANAASVETAALYWYSVTGMWFAAFAFVILPSMRPL
jgi:heme/copper-type cytochrome/quinol oxidase subunit 3